MKKINHCCCCCCCCCCCHADSVTNRIYFT